MLTFWESREIKPKLEKNLFNRERQDISDLWVLRQSIMRKTVWAVNYCFGHVLLNSKDEKHKHMPSLFPVQGAILISM
mgnify:CR=1 FL=1